MVELFLQRVGQQLSVTLGEYHTVISLMDLVLTENTWQAIYEDAAAYGKKLFDAVFLDEHIRALLASWPRDEHLLLIAEDPLVAAIPWEYLRDQEGKLLTSRIPMVRGLMKSQRRKAFIFKEPLEIIAIPVSPVDEKHPLNVEGEWRNLITSVTKALSHHALTLKRVRPPTLSQLEQSQNRQGTTLVHFMGHGDSQEGKNFLIFEDALARTYKVDISDIANSLDQCVFLVVLNSCFSALVMSTEFGNIAQSLVRRGIPYALGMQCIIPDEAALVLSEHFYRFLLRGYGVEEAVMRTRRALAEPGKLSHSDWLAGIPVLYTSLSEPTQPFEISHGHLSILPDPDHLQQTNDLIALPQARHFLGRSQEMSKALGFLLAPGAEGFVLLYGLGGIGKTSLARALAERVGWYYDDRVLALSFETFARFDQSQQCVIDETFTDRFYNLLARFYGVDPSDPRYETPAALQQAILQKRRYQRSLLVFDNIETLFDAQSQAYTTARTLAGFLNRLREGNGVILFTSRQLPPTDWGAYTSILLSGLSDADGADLFAELLPEERRASTSRQARQALNHRVQGHPLSLRLLAGHFADQNTATLDVFLEHLEGELTSAEQHTPTSLEDPERQRTLYACLAYSIKRLTTEQEQILRAVSLFQSPFPAEFVNMICPGEQTLADLEALLRLSLLEVSAPSRTFPEGELLLLELHPMVRWYIEQHLLQPEPIWQERYGDIYASLLVQARENYDNDTRFRYLIRLSLPDSEAALQYLPLFKKGVLAYNLALPYRRLGQNQRALTLYEQALHAYQELGDDHGIVITQQAIANVLMQQGKPQEALALYERVLHTSQGLGFVDGIAGAQYAIANTLMQQGKLQEALVLYEQVLRTNQELSNVREIAITQQAIADVLVRQDKPQEALVFYEQALRTSQELSDIRGTAITQHAIADILARQGKLQEALVFYEQALRTSQELSDIRGIAITQLAIARVLARQGKLQEALAIYEQVLRTDQELGDVREIAITQQAIADALVQQGKPQEALVLYEQALHIYRKLGNDRTMAVTQQAMANVLVQQGKLQEALVFHEQALHTYQEIGDIRGIAAAQHAIAEVLMQQDKPQEALVLYEQALHIYRKLGNDRTMAVTQQAMANVLVQQGKLQEALVFHEQALHTYQKLGDMRGVATAQYAIADVLVRQDKPQEALVLYEQALHIYRKLGNDRTMAVTQHAIANILMQQGKFQEALVLYEQALHTYQELGNVREIASAYGMIAVVLMQQGKLQEALVFHEQALHTYQEIGDIRGIAAAQHAIAEVLMQQDKPQEALVFYERVLHTFQELGNVRGIAAAQSAIANVLMQQDKPQEALVFYEQTLHTYQELGNVRGIAIVQQAVADAQGAIANILMQQDKPQEALVFYEQALHTYQELGNVREIAITYGMIAEVLMQQGRLQEALVFYEQTMQTLTEVLMQPDTPQEALILYEQALQTFQEFRSHHPADDSNI